MMPAGALATTHTRVQNCMPRESLVGTDMHQSSSLQELLWLVLATASELATALMANMRAWA
jgi:hypothetical protein